MGLRETESSGGPSLLKKTMEVKFIKHKTDFILKNSAVFGDPLLGLPSVLRAKTKGLCPLPPTRPGAWGAANGHLN